MCTNPTLHRNAIRGAARGRVYHHNRAAGHDIFLIPGFFGFERLGRLVYFRHVRDLLAERCARERVSARIHVVRTHPTASLTERAALLLDAIAATPPRGAVHLIGHSSGGLDARLLAAPGVSLPSDHDVESFAARIRTVVTISTPHRGTPLASFFASLLGQQMLRAFCLTTVSFLRFGHVPIGAVLRLGAVLARSDDAVVPPGLLDEMFALLLDPFSVGRRRAVQALLREVADDQALLVQLTPQAMRMFNAAIRDRPGVRYASVTTSSPRPSLTSTLAAGLDPSRHAMHAVYGALHALTSRADQSCASALRDDQARTLRSTYAAVPTTRANDGIVPTRSQIWGDLIHAAIADHLDVIGHFDESADEKRHVDWLTAGTGFTRDDFESLWSDVLSYVLCCEKSCEKSRHR
jgi:triacylglycerol lipase